MSKLQKKICFISNRYPNKNNPSSLVFLQQIIWALADLGVDCTVICPIPMNIFTSKDSIPPQTYEFTNKGNKINVFFPKYFSFGQKKLLKWNTSRLNVVSFVRAVERIINNEKINVDAFYGHFISPAGVAASILGKKYNKASYVAYGESSPWSIKNLGVDYVRKKLQNINGVISVSTKNKNDLLSLNILEEEKIVVLPNAIDPERFNKKDKRNARKRLGLPTDKFIISFVGQFIERKGIRQLDTVISEFDDVYAIYAGAGKIPPKDKKTLIAESIHPESLAQFYSASDVFVLPTNNEGCSNAIIEAMSCELPIISSDLSFNDDILDKTCSIRINVNSTEELFSAIKTIKDNKELRESLSKGSKLKAKDLTIDKRAKKLIEFINATI